MNSDHIETRHPQGRKGVRIPTDLYNQIVDFIVRQIDRDDDVTLASLIDDAERHLNAYPAVTWMVYHVKLDLEAKGFIKLVPSISNRNSRRLRLTADGIRSHRKLFV
jgi:hypothetical protein